MKNLKIGLIHEPITSPSQKYLTCTSPLMMLWKETMVIILSLSIAT